MISCNARQILPSKKKTRVHLKHVFILSHFFRRQSFVSCINISTCISRTVFVYACIWQTIDVALSITDTATRVPTFKNLRHISELWNVQYIVTNITTSPHFINLYQMKGSNCMWNQVRELTQIFYQVPWYVKTTIL